MFGDTGELQDACRLRERTMNNIEQLAKYLDERAAILDRRAKDPHCIDRKEQQARWAEVEAIRVRLAALEEVPAFLAKGVDK